jgi:hypothetical protein
MVTVPAQYDPLIREMSSSTGLPYDVIAAQASAESGFNPTARSPTGALGWLQFEPSTYNAYAAQAGVGPGSEFNPASEAKVYDVFMGKLLQQFHGNVRNALAAYNAGPGNIQAGYGYADKILGTAGQPSNITTTGFQVPGIGLPGIGGGLSISGILGNLFSDMRDILERFGLILLGGALILLGIHMLTSGGSNSSPSDTAQQASEAAAPAQGKHAKGASTTEAKAAAKGTGASEALEAAAVA